MAGSVFKILVFLIATVLIIALFFAIIQNLLPKQDSHALIQESIEKAMFEKGKAVQAGEKALYLKARENFNSEEFETFNSMILLQCNDEIQCCVSEQENCIVNLQWNPKFLNALKESNIKVFSRCILEHNLYVCKVFFGKKPAQVLIKEINAENSLNLNQNQEFTLNFKIENSGEEDSFLEINAKLSLFKKVLQDKRIEKQFARESGRKLDALKAGESKSFELSIPVNSPGNYVLELLVESEETGFDKKETEFTASGTASNCTATSKGLAESYSNTGSIENLRGNCVSRANCKNCNPAFECQNAWNAKEPKSIFESAEPSYAYQVLEITECSQ